ncbi:hypothetical protein [Actinomadura sp. RB99]|uniref:hypothetical protein n=1 Tax=Actinomadura sp. RB99 TaxID=2691577 RepID=UPI0019D69575|nr:hypothetical protein [Actinomadura sp. RB99]
MSVIGREWQERVRTQAAQWFGGDHAVQVERASVAASGTTAAGLGRLDLFPRLTGVAATRPTITKEWADTAYRTKAIDHAATLGSIWNPSAATPPPRVCPATALWMVERTFGWLMLHRRLARDCETCRPDPKP